MRAVLVFLIALFFGGDVLVSAGGKQTGNKGTDAAPQTVSVRGVGRFDTTPESKDKIELVIGNVAFALEVGRGMMASKGRPVYFRGTFDGKKITCHTWVTGARLKSITPHMFFEGEGTFKDDQVDLGGIKVELNFLPDTARDELEAAGQVRAIGMLVRTSDSFRYVLLKLEPAK